MGGSTRNEMFRATLRIRTPEGDFATLIVTRQGMGHARVTVSESRARRRA